MKKEVFFSVLIGKIGGRRLPKGSIENGWIRDQEDTEEWIFVEFQLAKQEITFTPTPSTGSARGGVSPLKWNGRGLGNFPRLPKRSFQTNNGMIIFMSWPMNPIIGLFPL